MPFIQRHLPIFEQLSPEIDWEWHVVEGVALGRADSRRPYSSRSMEDSHRQYRSKDGTSEYLDYIVSLPNSRVVLYRKPLGKAWKDKLEMINTVVHRLTRPTLLLQIDSDEIWNVEMIRNAIEIFHHSPNRRCAYVVFERENFNLISFSCFLEKIYRIAQITRSSLRSTHSLNTRTPTLECALKIYDENLTRASHSNTSNTGIFIRIFLSLQILQHQQWMDMDIKIDSSGFACGVSNHICISSLTLLRLLFIEVQHHGTS